MKKHHKLSDYEAARWHEIERWRAAPPDWGTQVLAGPSRIAALAAQKLVPESALRAAMRGVDQAAGWSSAQADVLRAAGVAGLDEVAALPLQECDRLARRVGRRAMALGGTGGALFGVGGALGLAADVPSLLTLALRTIHRSAFCYGEDWRDDAERSLAIGVFALASANSQEEKLSAWQALTEQGDLLGAAWRDGIERVAERHLAKEATQFSLKTLAQRIGLNLGRRKVLGVVPLLGAAIGGAVNAGYLHDIAVVARHVLQYRWLLRQHPELAPGTSRGSHLAVID